MPRIPNVQRKKSWEIVKSSKDKFTAIDVDGGNRKKIRKFGKHGAFVTHDAGEARYIEEAFGSHSKTGDGSVMVCEVDNAGTRAPRRAFVINAPWKDNENEN
jgi:hypothetical protein